ncbi:hypothetical protein M422DRAFT_785885 [Sphaerobolus stellatus SS14]|uniref:Unplaced genomic scaffold SPHSTscaffold_422, whole genome shotgun sequence n=1 Tax=Sphaerobolus stellatus (strain SS14) TaxID=990650 RepID=A0A0C9T623_SPHS4|nr:hypothetical protein M422DRAFT_785885 [Sphaerobolus stellatus SS14]
MLPIPTSPVPCISISLAPHEILAEEPKSPFQFAIPEVPDSPKPFHLLPPPTLSPHQTLRIERRGQLSPLSSGAVGRGLEREKFEAMLKASRDRTAMVKAKKPVELRKEIAVKVQMAKQLQRRAKFLHKLAEPPSPSAADQPVTPPESPAIFHFSLPSPGLESPLEVFENLDNDHKRFGLPPRIEQVDFRLPSQKKAEEVRRFRREAQRVQPALPLPSLDEISQRLSKSPGSVRISRSPSPDVESGRVNRLPSFLRTRSVSPELKQAVPEKKPRLALALGNLSRFNETREPTPVVPKEVPFPPSPKSPLPPKLQITTTLCPPTRSKSSPTEFTEANVTQFTATHTTPAMQQRVDVGKAPVAAPVIPTRRAELTKDMFNKLSRRNPCLAGAAACGIKAKDDIFLTSPSEGGLKRRTSAPAELPASQRKPRHPVLDKPGGF